MWKLLCSFFVPFLGALAGAGKLPLGVFVLVVVFVGGVVVFDHFDRPWNLSRDEAKLQTYVSALVQPGQPSSEAISEMENIGLRCDARSELREFRAPGFICFRRYTSVFTTRVWFVQLAVENDRITQVGAGYNARVEK